MNSFPEGYNAVHAPCCGIGPCWCLWSDLPPDTVLRSMSHCDSGDHVEVCGPCFHQKLCQCLWSVLPLTLKGKDSTFAGGLMTTHLQLRKRNIELQWLLPTSTPSPPKYPPRMLLTKHFHQVQRDGSQLLSVSLYACCENNNYFLALTSLSPECKNEGRVGWHMLENQGHCKKEQFQNTWGLEYGR